MDQSSCRAASCPRSRTPLHLGRRARGQPACPRSCSPGRCSAQPSPQTRPAFWFRPTAGLWAVEINSSVPLMSGERVVGVFGLFEGRPNGGASCATSAPHPASSRGASPSRSRAARRRQTAADLHLSIVTVRNHIRRLFRALGVHSRLEAVAAARASSRSPIAPATIASASEQDVGAPVEFLGRRRTGSKPGTRRGIDPFGPGRSDGGRAGFLLGANTVDSPANTGGK